MPIKLTRNQGLATLLLGALAITFFSFRTTSNIISAQSNDPRQACAIAEITGKLTRDYNRSLETVSGHEVFLVLDDGTTRQAVTDENGVFSFRIRNPLSIATAQEASPFSLAVRPPDASFLPLRFGSRQTHTDLQGGGETGYRFPATINLCEYLFDANGDGTADTLDLGTETNSPALMIPSLYGNMTVQGDYSDFTALGLDAIELVLENTAQTVRTVASLQLEEGEKISLALWSYNPSGENHRMYITARKDGRTVYLPIRENNDEDALYPLLEDDGFLRYRLPRQGVEEKLASGTLFFELDNGRLPLRVAPIQGFLFKAPPNNDIPADVSVNDLWLDESFLFREDELINYEIQHLVNQPVVAYADFDETTSRSPRFQTEPALPLNPESQHQLIVMEKDDVGTRRCLKISAYSIVNQTTDNIELTVNDPFEMTVPSTDIAMLGGAVDHQIVLFVDSTARNNCLDGRTDNRPPQPEDEPPLSGEECKLEDEELVCETYYDKPTAGKGGSSDFPENWCTAEHRASESYNAMGMHILTEQGALSQDVENACPVVGNWGFVKGLWYPPSLTGPAIEFVNESHQRSMIPVLRLATSWTGEGIGGMINPNAFGLTPDNAASLIQQVADGRSDSSLPVLFQIFNEPNWATEWVTGNGEEVPDRAQEYAQYMIDLYAALPGDHVQSQNYFIVSAGLSPAPGAQTIEPLQFVRDMAAVSGFADSFDVWGSQAKLSDNNGNAAVDPTGIDSCENYSGTDGFHPCFYQAELNALLGSEANVAVVPEDDPETTPPSQGRYCEIGSRKPVFLLEAGYHDGIGDRTAWTRSVIDLWRGDSNILGTTFWVLQDPFNNDSRFPGWKWMGTPLYDNISGYLDELGIGNPACGGNYEAGSNDQPTPPPAPEGDEDPASGGNNNLDALGEDDYPMAGVPPGRDGADPRLLETLQRVERDTGVSAELLLSMLVIENGRLPAYDRQYVCSYAGACGLGQLMPNSWNSVRDRVGSSPSRRNSGTPRVDNPEDNLFGAGYFMKDRLPACNNIWDESSGRRWCATPESRQPFDNPSLDQVGYMGWRYYGSCNRATYSYRRCSNPSDASSCHDGTYCDLMQFFYTRFTRPANQSSLFAPPDMASLATLSPNQSQADFCPADPGRAASAPLPIASWLPSAHAEENQATEVFVWHDVNANQTAEPDEPRLPDQTVAIWPIEDWHYDAEAQQYRCADHAEEPLWQGKTDENGRVSVELEQAGLVDIGVKKLSNNARFTGFSGPISEVGRRNAWIQMTCGDWHIIRVENIGTLGMEGALRYGVIALEEAGTNPESDIPEHPYRILPDTTDYYEENRDIRGYGELFLQPLDENFVVYELSQRINEAMTLDFDYRYQTDYGEGAPIDFSVIANDGENSYLLFQPEPLIDGLPWQTATLPNGEGESFTADGRIDLTPFEGKSLRIRFVAKMAAGEEPNRDQALANAMQLRRITLKGSRLDTSIGYYPDSQRDTRVLGFWEQNVGRAYLSQDPHASGDSVVHRLLDWVHPRIGFANESGYLIQGKIEQHQAIELCDLDLNSALGFTPISAVEPTRLDYNFASSGGSSLQGIYFTALPDCLSGEQNVNLKVLVQVLDENNAIDPDQSEILASLGKLEEPQQVSLDLRSYLGKRIVLSLVAEAMEDVQPTTTLYPVYVGNLELDFEDFSQAAATSLPVLSLLGVLFPLLFLMGSIGGLYFLIRIVKR